MPAVVQALMLQAWVMVKAVVVLVAPSSCILTQSRHCQTLPLMPVAVKVVMLMPPTVAVAVAAPVTLCLMPLLVR